MGAVVDNRAIRGEGTTAERDWRTWLDQQPWAPLDLDLLQRPTARLVVVAPHPDDEVLACGGLLALHAQRGGPALVVAATDGEASHRADATWSPADLAATRRAERERGLAALGVSPMAVQRIGLPDGQVASHPAALQRALEEVLRADDLVVTTWRGDGHPDHDATGAAAARACRARGCTLLEAPVWMWHWAETHDPRVPWHRLRGMALGSDAQRRKREALAHHVSQRTPRGPTVAPVLGPAIVERAMRSTEYYLVPDLP